MIPEEDGEDGSKESNDPTLEGEDEVDEEGAK
jgi:hypothetical protein